MKKNRTIRFSCLLIAILMMLCTFVACADSGDENPGADTTTPAADQNNPGSETTVAGDSGDATTTTPGYDVNGFKLDDVPTDTLNYNQAITLLYWEDVEHEEFVVEEQTGDNVADAIFYRNMTIEDRLGITMEHVTCLGDSGETATWTKYIDTSLQAGGGEFDVIAGYSLSMASSAAKGYLYDLLDPDCEYLNFEMPWWPESLINEATINDKLYFASGDISANALYMMYVCFVNNNIAEDMNIPNIYELVDNNQWTYDKFIELCSNVYIDEDGSGDKSVGDRFGYMVNDLHTDPWFYGTGALIVDKDSSGNLQFAESFTSERVISAIDKLNGLLWNTNDAYFSDSAGANGHQGQFNEGKLLFACDRCRVSITKFDSEDLDYSVVPFPKYDSQQEKFVTVMGNPFTLYALPIDAKSEELPMLSAYLEVYASESYRQVTPQLFEVSLKVKYTMDNDAARMYDIIRSTLCFDLGRIFSKELIGQSAFRSTIENNRNNWASAAKQYERIMNTKLKTLITAYNG